MGRNRGTVTLEKDGVTHEFVRSSVPVWEARGWKQTAESKKEEAKAAKVAEAEQKAEQKAASAKNESK